MEESSKLYKRFLPKSDFDLIEIIESQDNYTVIAVNVAKEIVAERNMETEKLEKYALEFWRRKFNSNIKQFLKSQNIPESNFLEEPQLKELMKISYQDYLEKRESMEVDSTKYWFI